MGINKSNWGLIIVIIGVALVASIATASVTGNVIKINQDAKGKYKVYTTSEVDTKLKALKGTCQYIHYKDSYTGYDINTMSIMDVCQKILGGFVPKIIVETQSRGLHNRQNCEPSYEIYGTTADKLISYKTELADIKLGQLTSNACNNAIFPDGSSNEDFSTQTHRLYSGVLCCKN